MNEMNQNTNEQPVNAFEGSHSIEQHINNLNVQAHEGPDGPMTKRKDRLEDSLEQKFLLLQDSTDIEFIRREMRFIPALINFWTYFRFFGKARKDPRSKAALTALLWRIFSPGAATAAVGGGLMILFTALQVTLVKQQNAKLDQQTHIMQSQTNVALLSHMGTVIQSILEQAQSTCLSKETAATFGVLGKSRIDPRSFGVDSQRPPRGLPKCWIDVQPETRQLWILACSSDELCLAAARKSSPEFRSIEERRLPDVDEPMERTMRLSNGLHGQVISLSQSARPYRFIDSSSTRPISGSAQREDASFLWRTWASFSEDDNPRLIDRPLSPERGTLLSLLVALGYQLDTQPQGRGDYSSAYVERLYAREFVSNISFYNVSLPYAEFGQARFGFTLMSMSDVRCGNFSGADLSNSRIEGGDYSGAHFSQAFLPANDDFSPGDLTKAYLEGAIVTDKDFLVSLAARGVRGFDPSHYELVEREKNKKTYKIVFRSGLTADEVMGRSICNLASPNRR